MYDSAFGCTMPQSVQVEQELAELDRCIGEAEMGITRQIALIDRLARDGHDTAEAHAFLNEMKGDLAAIYAYRRILVRRVNERAFVR